MGFIDKSKFDPLDSDETGDGCLNAAEKIWLETRRVVVVGKLRQHLVDVQPHQDYCICEAYAPESLGRM